MRFVFHDSLCRFCLHLTHDAIFTFTVRRSFAGFWAVLR